MSLSKKFTVQLMGGLKANLNKKEIIIQFLNFENTTNSRLGELTVSVSDIKKIIENKLVEELEQQGLSKEEIQERKLILECSAIADKKKIYPEGSLIRLNDVADGFICMPPVCGG